MGSRLPRANRVALANWVMSHPPIALAITAAGAGMVSLIGHAHDATTPAATSWLPAGGAVAALFVGWLRPAPWLLALLLVAILSAVWFFAVSRFLRADAWGKP